MTILVVDDDAATRDLLNEALRDEGYPVVTVGSAEEALSVLQHRAGVRLVLLDLELPGIGGAELYRQLSADPALTAIPVVLISAGTTLDQQGAALRPTAAMPKPFELEPFLALVERLYVASAALEG